MARKPAGKSQQAAALGQFFTPPSVVDFACRALMWLASGATPVVIPRSEATRNLVAPQSDCRPYEEIPRRFAPRNDSLPPEDRRRTRTPPSPRAIDPACGDGAFILGALRNELAIPAQTVGLDKDPALTEAWKRAGLMSPHGPRMVVTDGLLPSEDGAQAAPEGSFDFVIGNPPFHGHGIRHEAEETLRALSRKYMIWRRESGSGGALARLRLYPVELLFLERFLQLARPGGLAAIVLPEGVFANARQAPERQWLFAQHTVHAIVGLPRATFRPAGITAKTSLCVIGKEPPPGDHAVFLAEIEDTDAPLEESLGTVWDLWQTRRTRAEPKPWLPVPE
jgi:hypothetical protein